MAVITFKVSDAEARQIRRSAKREHTTVSGYLRRKALGEAEPCAPGFAVCPVTGARIFARTTGLPPLTSESVREMLADFP